MATDHSRQRMTPSEAFVETLVANGVKDVFGIVGSAYMDAHDLFPLAGIRFVSVAHEQNAAHMADGYARATGRHGVCIGQNGPGVTNFVTAIAAAYWAHSPVVAITPEAGSLTAGLGGFQETEQLPIFSKITKLAGPGQQSAAHRRAHRARVPLRAARAWPDAGQHSPRSLLRRDRDGDSASPLRVNRGAGDRHAIATAARCSPMPVSR
jgi:sulfoacetaldehyde acetyltransferase